MSDVPVTACWLAALLLARRPSLARRGARRSGRVARRPDPAEPRAARASSSSSRAPPRREDGIAADGRWRRMVAVRGVHAAGPGRARHTSRTCGTARRSGPATGRSTTCSRSPTSGRISPRYPRWLTMAHSPFLWLWLLAPLWFRRAARASPRVRLDRLRLRRRRDRGLSAVRLLPSRRMVVHALPAAGAAADAAASRAAWCCPRRADGCRQRPLGAAPRCCSRSRPGRSRTASRSACSACAKGSASIRRSARSCAISCRRPRSCSPRSTAAASATTRTGRPCAGICSTAPRSIARSASMRDAGYDPFLVVDAGEDEAFRQRFGGTGQHAVDGADAARDHRQHDGLRVQMSGAALEDEDRQIVGEPRRLRVSLHALDDVRCRAAAGVSSG